MNTVSDKQSQTPAPGQLYVISAPSGGGKTSLTRALIERLAAKGRTARFSVSYTTRDPREGERDGVDYHFMSVDSFKQMIAEAALQEDVDVVGLSILSGAHLELFPRVVQELRERGVDDVLLFCGGIIPEQDISAVKELGFSGVFGPGTNTADIIEFIGEQLSEHVREQPQP